MKEKLFIILCLFFLPRAHSQNNYTVSGTVSDSVNGETTIGALVYIKGNANATATNVYGFYSLTLPGGKYDITVSFPGYKTQIHHIDLEGNITLNPKLQLSENALKEVVVSDEANKQKEQIGSTQMSSINIPVEQIKNIPTIGGETDIVKVMQLMPGVKRGGEGQNQMFVRGGSGDDNLILLDEAVVYNISHLFGFFSVFNNDALKDVTLIKGGFPAQYGGRLSSVMDIRMKDGDMQKYHVDGGIGTLSSHLTLQGPIIKNRMSFIISGRRSYIDQLFKLVYKGKDVLPYYFYDATCKLNYKLSDKNRLYFSTYYGNDILSTNTKSDSSFFDGGFKLGNITSTLRWNHLFNEKLFSNLSLIYTRFRYDVEASVPGNSFLAKSKISDLGIKYDFSYFKNSRNAIKYGVLFTNHNFRPNVVNTSGEISEQLKSKEGKLISTQEIGAYINHEYDPFARLKINYGLRLSTLITNTVYFNPEPRASVAFIIKENQSVKLSYSRMCQYLHLVSSSSIALPTDLWYPVTAKVKPQQSDQVAIGYNYLFKKIKTTVSIESYYKKMKNLVEYREGAVLLLNDNYEDELVKGKGDAYGFEFFAQRMSGKFTGWIGYTISWSTRKFDDLNHGKTFYAKYDRRHDISVVASYDFTKRFSASVVWVFSTGQRFTPITGYFSMPNSSLTHIDLLPVYADKNSQQFPVSHRLDISFIFKSRLDRKWMKWTGEWHIGAYNVYNRAQPYRVEVVGKNDGSFKYQAKGLFGFIPFVAYNFKF
jgi:hypothetical protein